MTRRRRAAVAALVLGLGLVAWASPAPNHITDRDTYEAIARQIIIPNCDELHCFRLLVPTVIGVIPGSSLVKWKVYAVSFNALAGIAVGVLALTWGLSRQGAWMAGTMSAFGFGALYTLHDPFTADPLMYFLGPFLLQLLSADRIAVACGAAIVCVLAKEFALAPLAMFAATAWTEGRRAMALKVAAAAGAGFLLWLALQVTLIRAFHYSYNNNPSTNLLGGGYLLQWWNNLAPSAAVMAMVGELGALWILAPAGWFAAPPAVRRIALAAVPVAAIFAYVQQPDRALWNLHFVATPLAAFVLQRVPPALAWSIVGLFVAANLRIGAQLPWVPAARFALAASAVLGTAAIALAWRQAPQEVMA